MYKFGLSVFGFLAFLIVTLAIARSKSGQMKLTKVLCETMDPNIVVFKQCVLEKNRENRMSFSMHISLYKNFTNILINARLYRNVNSKYVPFFYDMTINFCDFIQNPKDQIFWELGYKLLTRFSNINHSCPYDHDLIIKNIAASAEEMKLIPLPRGDYMVQLQAGYDNTFIAKGQLFCSKM